MVSVCMATYNGELFIEEQIRSILVNMQEYDELIVSDDGSSDKTLEIINQISDGRIRVVSGPQKGLIKNFEHALELARGDYIFLTDQDDVWEKSKVETVMKAFREYNCSVVVHDATLINGDGERIGDSFFYIRKSRDGLLKNFTKNSYLGCCMAMRKEMRDIALPIPNDIEMHDWWIGMLSECCGKSVFIRDKLVRYRRHGHNVSQMHHHPVKRMISMRVYLALQLAVRTRKLKRNHVYK